MQSRQALLLLHDPGVEHPWIDPLRHACSHLNVGLTHDLGSRPAVVFLCLEEWPVFQSALEACQQRWSNVPMVAIVPERELASPQLQQAFALGLRDFLPLPIRPEEAATRLRLLCLDAPEEQDFDAWKRAHSLENLIGESSLFERALRRVPLMAAAGATVTLLGETGTGKELFAHAIHYCSPRKSGPFVPVNCGALPDQLLENELFGHRRGAYTDARSDSPGLLAIARGGTLFLDEVDSLSQSGQVKLLRLLQSHEYRPLGSTETRSADVRIVAAANRDMSTLVSQGVLREDLFHRLNVLRITIPPLRAREGDGPLLARFFLERFTRIHRRPALRFSAAALSAIVSYAWPGNIRELEGVVQRAVLLCTGVTIQPDDLDLSSAVVDASPKSSSMKDAKVAAIGQFEREYLLQLLERCKGNVSKAAQMAGKERRSFQRLLQKHGVSREAFL